MAVALTETELEEKGRIEMLTSEQIFVRLHDKFARKRQMN
jgi:hypothetical protein